MRKEVGGESYPSVVLGTLYWVIKQYAGISSCARTPFLRFDFWNERKKRARRGKQMRKMTSSFGGKAYREYFYFVFSFGWPLYSSTQAPRPTSRLATKTQRRTTCKKKKKKGNRIEQKISFASYVQSTASTSSTPPPHLLFITPALYPSLLCSTLIYLCLAKNNYSQSAPCITSSHFLHCTCTTLPPLLDIKWLLDKGRRGRQEKEDDRREEKRRAKERSGYVLSLVNLLRLLLTNSLQ